MKKKVGIITFHSAHNYGAMLQAYALQKKIQQMDKNVEIINYRNKKIDNRYRVFNIRSKNPIRMTENLWTSIRFYKSNKKRFEAFDEFMNKELKLSNTYNHESEIKWEEYDICITGSDQVWNPGIVGKLSNAYTLNFENDNVKKISYAASIGTSNIDEKYQKEYQSKLSKIDCISVRESDAKKSLENFIDKEINVVLDPTFLLDKDEWNSKIKNIRNVDERYICAYVVKPDEEYVKIVNNLSEKTGLKVIHFGLENPGYSNVLKSAYTEGPLEFVNYIKNAEYVVATSFHATVFSIIFNKKFFIVPHKQTGSRVTNLLDRLEIPDRVFYTMDDFRNIDYDLKDDWKKINNKLEIEREKSVNWLSRAIEGD